MTLFPGKLLNLQARDGAKPSIGGGIIPLRAGFIDLAKKIN
jgi:hypothetical protein